MNEVCALERVQRSVERRSGIARHARRRVKIYLANNLLLLARTVRGKSFSTFATLSQSFSRSNSTELRIEIEISFYRLWLSNSFEIQALFASSYIISNTIPITSYIYIYNIFIVQLFHGTQEEQTIDKSGLPIYYRIVKPDSVSRDFLERAITRAITRVRFNTFSNVPTERKCK